MKRLIKLSMLIAMIMLCCCVSAYANTYTSLYNQSDLLAAPGGGLNLMIYTFGQYSRVFIPPGTIGFSMGFFGNTNGAGTSASRFGHAPDPYTLPINSSNTSAIQLESSRASNIYSGGQGGIIGIVTQNYYTPLSAAKAGWFYMDAYMQNMQYIQFNITVDTATYTAWYNANASGIDCPCAATGTCQTPMCSAAACSTPVTPSFIASTASAATGQTVNFTNTSSSFNAAWLWTASGGTCSATNQQNFSCSFPSAGTYTVKLTSTPTDTNCSASTTPTQTITVSQQQQCTNPVTADFTINNSTGTVTVTSGNSVSFNNTSSGNATYSWTFGDGISSALQSPPAHTYTNTGTSSVTYTVTLTATPTTTGCSNQSKIQYVTVNPAPVCTPALTAKFNTIPSNTDGTSAAVIYADKTVTFTNTSTKTDNTLAADSDAKSWSWIVKNNSGVIVDMATSYNFPVAFPDPGNYTITLTATDLNGCVSQPFTQTVTAVSLCAVTAGFTASPNPVQAGQAVTFTNTSTKSGGTAATSTDATWLWDFGDGSYSSTFATTHAYAASNKSYTVKLTATDVNNCSTTSTASVTAAGYTVNFAAGTGGTVSPTAAQTVANGGSTTAVTATANSGYTFSNWTNQSGTVVSTSATLPAQTVTSAMTYIANFQQQLQACDANNNGKLGLEDVIYILQVISGLR